MQIQPLNSLKTVLKVSNLSSTIAMIALCFDVLSQVCAIGHCVIGQERDLLWPDWLNWWVCPWVPSFEIQIFPHNLKLWNSRASVGWFSQLTADDSMRPLIPNCSEEISKYIFAFSIPSQSWYDTGHGKIVVRYNRKDPLSYIAKAMAADDLATQGARASAAMVST